MISGIKCNCCGKDLPKGGLKYIIEIKSFADFDGYLEDYPGEMEEGLSDLLDAMDNIDTATMEEDVYQELIYILCKDCKNRFTTDPFCATPGMFDSQGVKGTVH